MRIGIIHEASFMSFPNTDHPFRESFLLHLHESEDPISLTKAMDTWNILLDQAIENIALQKDQFVLEGEYESALVALWVQQTLGNLKAKPDSR